MGVDATFGARAGRETPTFEPRWPASLAVLTAMTLWLTLPSRLILGSRDADAVRVFVVVLALALLVPLAVTAPHRHVNESGKRRLASMALTAIVSVVIAAALVLLIRYLLTAGPAVHGKELLLASAQIWWTNVIASASGTGSSTVAGLPPGCASPPATAASRSCG